MSGGNAGLSGGFTPTGKLIVGYYFTVFVLGLLITHWLGQPLVYEMLLNPLSSGRFGYHQLLTHVLVLYPQHAFGFVVSLLMFWLFAWQVEAEVGRKTFLGLVVGVPLLAGALVLPFSSIPQLAPGTAPLAGFYLVTDILLVAFCTLHRDALLNLYFVLSLKAQHLLWLLLGFNTLTFLAMENPTYFYQLAAMGLTWIYFRFELWQDRDTLRLRFQAARLRRRQSSFEVIQGGKRDRPDREYYH
jgi:hypothetical protein